MQFGFSQKNIMDKIDVKKPAWSKEPENLDFKLVNQPLEEVKDKIFARLKEVKKSAGNFHFLLEGLLFNSFQTYKAIRKLVVEDPKYPTQGHILSRSLIDILFSILVLTEKPEEYSRWYEMAGYREAWEEHDREIKRYGNNPEDKPYLDEKKRFLDAFAQRLDLSSDERTKPTEKIKYWPIPSQILKSNIVNSQKQAFLKEVYYWRYGQISEWSHQQWSGMAMGIFADKPEVHWHPGKFESDAVYAGILFLLMILSEIEASCQYGFNQKLKYIWTILGSCFEEARDYYKLRYSSLLDNPGAS